MKCSLFSFCKKKSFNTRFCALLNEMPISEYNRNIIKSRYVVEVIEVEWDVIKTSVLYTLFNLFITIASILVTSFISLEKLSTVPTEVGEVFFWIGWSLSIFVLIINKAMSGFNIYQRYILSHDLVEKYYNEGWAFVEGSGKYTKLSNQDKLMLFFNSVEEINSKNILNMNKLHNEKTEEEKKKDVPVEKIDYELEDSPHKLDEIRIE